MTPLMPKVKNGKANAATFSAPAFGISIAATVRAIATPTAITVKKKHKKILRNRLRIQISCSPNSLDAFRTVFELADFLAEIADVCVDAPVVWRKLTPKNCSHQVFACHRRPGYSH